MPSKIRVLDDITINKIAAGEVVENAASVVKELVENALDAGSSEITIEIKGGGRQLIRITDNGCGMNPDDALLCLERHATSKIRQLDDIFSTYTMGFRGEAIPSIASVSKFSIITSPKENPHEGTMILIEGGKILKCSPAARTEGTTIEVKSLFFNVPARRKFQKSPDYDKAEIQKWVIKLALGNPHIKFQLIADQQSVILTTPLAQEDFHEALCSRAYETLGSEFSTGCKVDLQKEDISIRGLIGQPTHHRPNRTGQYLFINRRVVQSPFVANAIAEAYGTTLPTRRFPLFILHLTLPGDLVDVNVHPQKKEVRLRLETQLKGLLSQAIGKALFKGNLPEASYVMPTITLSLPPPSRFNYSSLLEETPFLLEPPKANSHEPSSFPEIQLPLPTSVSSKTYLPAVPRFRVMATLPRYTLAHQEDRIVVVDNRAAEARILFERLQSKEEFPISETQSLLIPYTIELSSVETAILKEHQLSFHKMGVGIRNLGQNTFLIDSLPLSINLENVPALLQQILNDIEDDMTSDKNIALAMASSKAFMPISKRLNVLEAQCLLDMLQKCQHPNLCPLGNPILLALTSETLSSYFR